MAVITVTVGFTMPVLQQRQPQQNSAHGERERFLGLRAAMQPLSLRLLVGITPQKRASRDGTPCGGGSATTTTTTTAAAATAAEGVRYELRQPHEDKHPGPQQEEVGYRRLSYEVAQGEGQDHSEDGEHVRAEVVQQRLDFGGRLRDGVSAG